MLLVVHLLVGLSPRIARHSPPHCCAGAATDATATAVKVEGILENAREVLQPAFTAIDRQTERGLSRVLDAFRRRGVGDHHFAGVDGYGYGDIGRETLDEVYAELLGAEAALVRIQCFSGTHAIACALYGVLRPGDELLGVSGRPYDTLEEVIGLRGRTDDGLRGTLADFGVEYQQVELTDDGCFDLEAVKAAITPKTRMLHIQRSCGYAWRPSIPVAEIGRLSAWAATHHPDLVLFVDNCYGEFVEEEEPCHVGVHLVAGSLIKNPGGTIAPTGGYIAGRADLVAAASRRLAAPGVEGGATLGVNRLLYQGLFNAPVVVGESLKGATLVAHVMGSLGYECNPPAGAHRTDIIQSVKLRSREKVLAFCEAVQRTSPVGAHIRPVAGLTPGYGDETVFADGTFIEGSTLELSADGPLREPFAVYVQGGTHWTHWLLCLREALNGLAEAGGLESEQPRESEHGEQGSDDGEAAAAVEKEDEKRYAGRRGLKNT